MRTTRWIGTAIVVAIALTGAGTARPSEAVALRGVTVSGGTAEQRELARWAIGRFEATGLELPPIEIRFHSGGSGCRGHLGYSRGEIVDAVL